MLGEAKMAEINILQKMGPKNKKDIKRWRKQEKAKQEAIENAFRVNNDRIRTLGVEHEERD